MRPVYISGSFGILHPATGRHGVLICGTMSDEAMNVYRPLAFLADSFAAAGSPTLRLEYYGLGDSGGMDCEPGRYQKWLDNIAAGVRWLRQHCGVGSVTLVGVRIGAAFAARAACEIDDVETLVLLAPAPSGRRFLRELILRARVTAEIWQTQSRIDDGDWFEAHGLRLDRATHDALEQLDIGRLPRRPVPRALVLDQHDSPAGGLVAERLRKLDVDVTAETVSGLDVMLRDPYENAVPHVAFARAVAWHADTIAVGQTATTRVMANANEASDTLLTNVAEETPIRFGPNDSLFGILSVPMQQKDGAPPVLIANTGANPRYSNSRNAVHLARWFAAHGIASLRMDGAGIGDSAIVTGERGQPYSEQADQDLAAAVDEVSRRFPQPLVLLGMCSGAYHALRAAYDNPRVGGLILVNLQKFAWHDGDSLSVVQRTTFRTTRFYLQNLRSAAVWHRLMQGEINVGGISRALAGRVLRRVVAASDPARGLLHLKETQVGRIRRQVRGLRDRGVPILFVLSGNDPGLDEIAQYFGAQGRQFRSQPNVMFRMLEGADHTLSAHWARQVLIDMVAAFLRQRCNVVVDARDAAQPPLAVKPPMFGALFRRPVVIDTPGSPA